MKKRCLLHVVLYVLTCLPGLGESWGHVSRRSSLDGVSQELGSHLLQVLTSEIIGVSCRLELIANYHYYYYYCYYQPARPDGLCVCGLVAVAIYLLLPSFSLFGSEMS